MIRITDRLAIDAAAIEETFVRASGPGGQNVNKVSTAVQLRFDTRAEPALPDDVRQRLARLAGRRMTQEGVLVITARRHRTQEENRREARTRLFEMIRRAALAPPTRRPTRPTAAARRERLDEKRRRAMLKSLRRTGPSEEG